MVVGKWNYETHDYEPYVIPDDWYSPLYSDDMDEIVNCSSCGRKITFGECYTSREIQNGIGFGYPVCEKCYEEEWERERYWRNKKET